MTTTTNTIIDRINDALTFDANDDVALVAESLERLFDELDEMLDVDDDPTLRLALRAVSLAFTYIETTGTLPASN
jgi:hypothetical protein